MDVKATITLIERIKTEPSILFLGQQYLQAATGGDPFYSAVNNELCSGEMPKAPAYANLWNTVNDGKPLTREDFAKLYAVTAGLPTQEWLRIMLSMRWGMVFTSAVDTCITHCVGHDFNFEILDGSKSRFRREFMSKRTLHGVYLYGAVDGSNDEYPPECCNDQSLRRLRKRVNDRISWIYNDILCDYGVMVIEGWNPENDWLSFLLDNAGSMPQESIFLFGATSLMEKDPTIAGLVEDGILTLESKTFARILSENEYTGDESETVGTGGLYSVERIKTVTISSERGQDRYIGIPMSAISSLDNRITLLDDDLGYEGRRIDPDDLGNKFALYLQQSGSPNWSLCIPEMKFHFERDVDELLWDHVEAQLKKNTAYHHSVVVVEGVSNSGKTAALINLAMRLRAAHRYPVLYISGMPTQVDFIKNLKAFIKQHLVGQQDKEAAWIEKVIVIWDGNASIDAVRQYGALSHDLIECNALVIGSVYHHRNEDLQQQSYRSGVDYINVSAILSSIEIRNLKTLLQRIDNGLYVDFNEILSRPKSSKINLLFILQKLCKSRYSPEWKQVGEVLRQRFYTEVDQSETEVNQSVLEYQELSLIHI